nr:hypothetical protein [Tanacetum cinerariifolium]
AEAVSTTCYVLNRVLVTKPQNKTPYELLLPITAENKANKTAGPKETNNSAGTQDGFDSSKANNGDEKLNEDTDSKTNKKPVDQEDQAFLEELERLKGQAKKANDAAETLRKMFAQSTKDFLLQVGAARASSTNYILVDLPFRKKEIRTKWVYKNKKDERGVVVRNKARIFLAFASYMGFIVYQMDVKSSFLYGKIDEEVYVSQPSGFIDPKFPNTVYKVVKALYGLHQAPRAWYATLSTFLVQSGYKRGLIDKTLLMKKDKKDIMLTASTSIVTKKPLVKGEEAVVMDVHLYRSMIGSLMHLTASRPDIMYEDSFKCWLITTPQMVINLPCLTDKKELATPGQMTTGKELSNPLMAGSLPKTTLPTKLVNAARLKLTTARVYDAEGTYCLTNIEIFEGLAKIGYEKPSGKHTFYKAFFSLLWKFMIHTILQCLSVKTTSWNEFSSTMASAIIYLDKNQKSNFSRDFDTPLLTKKVFANMKRVGILQADAQSIPITTEPSTSKPQKKHKAKRKYTQEFDVPPTESPTEQNLPSPSNDLLPSVEDSLKLKELMEIEKLEGRVKRLEEENRMLKELKSVHSTDDADKFVIEKEKSSKQGRKIADINVDFEINLEKA